MPDEFCHDAERPLLLEELLKRYSSLRSLCVIVRSSFTFLDLNPALPSEATILIKYQKPNFVDVEVLDTRGRSHLWCDGLFIYQEFVNHPNICSIQSAYSDDRAIEIALGNAGVTHARLFLGRFEITDKILIWSESLLDKDICRLTARIADDEFVRVVEYSIRTSDLILVERNETVECNGIQTAQIHSTYEYLSMSDMQISDPTVFRHLTPNSVEIATHPIFLYDLDQFSKRCDS